MTQPDLRAALDTPPPYRGSTYDWMTPQEGHSLGWSEAMAWVRAALVRGDDAVRALAIRLHEVFESPAGIGHDLNCFSCATWPDENTPGWDPKPTDECWRLAAEIGDAGVTAPTVAQTVAQSTGPPSSTHE